MNLTRTTVLRLIKFGGAFIIGALIVSYAIWRSLNYARGPEILITDPPNGSTIIETSTIIRGQALRINNLAMNNQQIFIDEEGHFAEIITIFPGLNTITFTGQDQFGRRTENQIQLMGSKWPDKWKSEQNGTSTIGI